MGYQAEDIRFREAQWFGRQLKLFDFLHRVSSKLGRVAVDPALACMWPRTLFWGIDYDQDQHLTFEV